MMLLNGLRKILKSNTSILKINLNTATLEELQKIPGIGEVRARAVLSYRDEIGSFQTVDEIQQVPGIKGKTYEKIADYICVD